MLGTGRDNYLTIWKITEKDGRYTGSASSSRKNKTTNEYVNSWWNVKFVGSALEKAKNLKERDRIIVHAGDLSIENTSYKKEGQEKPQSFLAVTIFDFEISTPQGETTTSNSDDLPF